MKANDRRRLERLFDGGATVEDTLALERDAACDPELASELARVRALVAACEALPEPAHDRLDVERLVGRVRRALDSTPARELAPPPGPWARLGRWRVLVPVAAAAAALVVVTARRGDGPAASDPVGQASRAATESVAQDAPPGVVQPHDEPRPNAGPRCESPGLAAATEPSRDPRVGVGPTPTVMPEVLPTAPVDDAKLGEALATLAAVLAAEVAAGSPGDDPAGFAARVEAALASAPLGEAFGAAWPVASLADALLADADPAVATGAVRFVAGRPDALTRGRLGRALDRELDRELGQEVTRAQATDPTGRDGGRRVVRWALVDALAALGGLELVATRLDALASAGDLDGLLDEWAAWGRTGRAEGLASAIPRSAAPRTAAGLGALARLGRPGTDVLARAALDGSSRFAPDGRAREASADAALELLAAAPTGAASAEDLVRLERAPTGARLERALALVERTAALGAIDWLQGLARRGEPRALVTLARLPGDAPVDALLALDGEGFVRDEQPWRALVEVDLARVPRLVAGLAATRPEDAERLAQRLLEADVVAVGPALAAVAAEPLVTRRTRERAALALASLGAPSRSSGVDPAAAAATVGALNAALGAAWHGGDPGVVAGLVVAAGTWLGEADAARALEALGATDAARLARAAADGGPLENTLARQARVERLLTAASAAVKEPGRGARGAELR